MIIADRLEEEQEKKINKLKMLKMALVHDLGEIIVGDYKTWDDKGRIGKEEKEREVIFYKAFTNIFGKKPSKKICLC